MKAIIITLLALLSIQLLFSQPWQMDNTVFNPSGIPSLTFSQPRFADLDGDGDKDFMLGSSNYAPMFVQNTGSSATPAFAMGANIAPAVSHLDAEMIVAADMDGDGDLDLVSGGFTGLHLYLNTGTVTAPVFAEQYGYFSGLSVGSYPVPDMADVDNDGDKDMVIGLSEDGGVRLYTNTGTVANGIFSESNMQIIGDVGLYAYPVFCDLDSDNDQDILVGRDSHGFIYFQNTGNSSLGNWQSESSSFAGLGQADYWNSPDLVDLNNDGLFDLVFGTASGPLQYYVNAGTAETPVWQLNSSLFGGVIDVGGASSPVFFDFDADGDLDMISGSQMGNIKYFRNTGTLHAPAWEEDSDYFASIDHSIYAAVAIGDVNGDNLPDAIIGDLSGHLYYHRNTGTGFIHEAFVLTNVSLGGWSVPRLLDMDGDNDLDLVAGNEAGNLRYYQNQGTSLLPDWVEVAAYFGTIDVGTNCSPCFADIDGDGDWDFLAGDLPGDLNCFMKQGFGWTENTTLFSGISTDQNAAPALVDLDRDGDLDLVLGDYDGTFKYYRNQLYSSAVLNPPLDLSVQVAAEVLLSWNAPEAGSSSPFQHYNVYLDNVLVGSTNDLIWVFTGLVTGQSYTAKLTAQYIAGESVPATLVILVTGNEDIVQLPGTLQNWPNPFNPSTTISFSVNSGSSAALEIYNVKGQCVRSWQGFSAGEHKLTWNGCDEQGRQLASGIYLYRLHTPEGTQVRKMLLSK